ncbi:Uncharacterised protein [Mycobacterium tuberculosis]|uniref:Uncharacterized protein n=2 Tax=Mycobacterium tuberculosis TaxID=1773 RepID=A0A654T9E1_MYCTX|nr:Uncharacterised protein [Mycobacterium tuberculosis]CFE49486.1 Uncharacterised protein [Mycobacterium tuberculosis]COW66293.1 Uncharacterised protein [Mycobacterium tuberculosis]COX59551.1 Uncharacterised protein [Mycobacterium tuberculosis]
MSLLRVCAGSIFSSTTPMSSALSTPPAMRSCSAANWSCSASRSCSGAAANFFLCRMPTAALAPITATSASGQANTLVAFNDREFIAMYAPP